MIWLPRIAACAGPRPGKKLTKLPEKVPAIKALRFSNFGIFIVSVMYCFGISTSSGCYGSPSEQFAITHGVLRISESKVKKYFITPYKGIGY